MAITSSMGIGSGMDINGIVSQLIEAEGQPAFNAIDRKEEQANARVSGLGRLKSALSDFRTATGKLNEGGAFSQHKTNFTEETGGPILATASLGAAAGVYSMEVQQLAEAHKLTSNGYSGYDAVVGSGTLSFSVGENDFSVTLDGTNNTLEGLRDAINQSKDNSSVNASIINVDDGSGGTVSKLVLTSEETGTANSINITASGDAGLSALTYAADGGGGGMNQQHEARDAIILVDGQQATRSTNSITDVIQGVTLDLKTAEVGSEFNLDISLDEENIKEVTDSFVSAYNGLMSIAKELGRFDPEGEESGALIGNSTLRSVQSNIRQAVGDVVDSSNSDFNSLAMIGITIDRTGIMSLNNSEFSTALSENRNAVSDVFSSENGVAKRLDARLDQYLQSGGTFDLQTKSLNRQLSEYSENRDTVQMRLDNMERVLKKQFIAMDVAVGQFQSMSSALAAQLANL